MLASFSVVSGVISASGTPCLAARSTNSSRSPPESPMAARPPGPTRRGTEKSDMVAANSSSVSTR